MKVKTDIEISENGIVIKATETGFSLEIIEPEQFGKNLFFYPEKAESIKTAIEDYIRARDAIRELNFPATPTNLE